MHKNTTQNLRQIKQCHELKNTTHCIILKKISVYIQIINFYFIINE